MKKLEKRNISFNEVKSKLTGWASQFGLTSLKLDINKDTSEIMRAMSPENLVYQPKFQYEGKYKKDAIPLKWPKVDYRPITIRNNKGKTDKVKPNEQTKLRSRGGRKTEPIGVSSKYFKRSGKFQNKEERPKTKQATFRKWLSDSGYEKSTYKNDPYEADHVIDVTFSGDDVWEDLWPLAVSAHREKTDKVWNQQKVPRGAFKGSSVTQIRSRKGKINKMQ